MNIERLHAKILTLCPPPFTSFTISEVLDRCQTNEKAKYLNAISQMLQNGLLRKGKKYLRTKLRNWGTIELDIDPGKFGYHWFYKFPEKFKNKKHGRRLDEILKENKIEPNNYDYEIINILRDHWEYKFPIISIDNIYKIIDNRGLQVIDGWISYNWRK